jgi:predicted permease
MTLDRLLIVLRLRLRSIIQRNRVDDDLADEVQFHLEERAREFEARGMTRAAARDAALRAFGGIEQRKEECRDQRRVGWIEDAARDFAYAIRTLRRNPAFAATAVASLTIGIGAATAIFMLTDRLLLKPLSVERPEELRVVWQIVHAAGRELKASNNLPYLWFRDLRAASEVFSDVLAFTTASDAEVSANGRQLQANGGVTFVSDNYFPMLGVTADLRDASTTVLGDTFWRRELNADPSIAGKQITINGTAFTVAGVAPKGFFGLALGEVPDLYMSLDALAVAQPSVAALADRRNWNVHIVGRLGGDTSDRVATERLTLLRRADPDLRSIKPPPVIELRSPVEGLSDVRATLAQPLTILLLMVALLLCIASANVATMTLARGAARRQEMLLRGALGAARARLVRQLAVETGVLVAAAGGFGLVFAASSTPVLLAWLPVQPRPIALDLDIDLRVVCFAVMASAMAALIAGVVPAWRTLRQDAAVALRARGHVGSTAGSARAGLGFIAAQVTLSMTLVAAAALLTRTLVGLTAVSPGFDADGLVLATVNPGTRGYDEVRRSAYYRDVLARLRAMPAVEAVTLLQVNFMTDARTTGTLSAPGFTPAAEEERWVQVYQVGPEFFSTFRIPLVAGRDFADQDLSSRSVVVALNETAARRYFGNESAVGRTVFGDSSSLKPLTVVGVAHDARYNTLRDRSIAAIFVPYTTARRSSMTFVVRAHNRQSSAAAAVAAEIRALDRSVPLQVTTLDRLVSASVDQEKLLAALASAFAVIALMLLCVGLYGLVAFWVTERTPEIGVRLALGARRVDVVWDTLRRPLISVFVGSGIGLLTALATGRLAGKLLFGVTPHDPSTVLFAAAVLLLVTPVAAFVPALRATRIDPITALRCE